MPRYELYPRYAEEPMITITAKDDATAERKAAALAKRGKASGGYREGGSLCPMEIKPADPEEAGMEYYEG